MKYEIEIWPIIRLIELYENDNLNLNPPYQRNAIWSTIAQKLLIDTIKNGMPIPVFFLQSKKDKNYEMVDGQQRTRAILGYIKKFITDNEGNEYKVGDFDSYNIPVCILSEKLSIEEVREFYVRVNKTGLKLERPELNKAEFFDTTFLKLVTELTDSEMFASLNLFKNSDIKRMFDRDYVEELVSLLINGITDKKKAVDKLFRTDLDKSNYQDIRNKFESVLTKISMLDDYFPIKDSRYSQKNDFYTFFGLIIKLDDLSNEELIYMYKVLLNISKGISPSNENCEPLQDYAINCVTQSNSKKAREKRLDILESILLNEIDRPNIIQRKVSKYFTKEITDLVKNNKYYTLNNDLLK